MKKQLLTISIIIAISSTVIAKDYTPQDYKYETTPLVQAIDKIEKFTKTEKKTISSFSQKNKNTVKMDEQKLLANPFLLKRAILSVILTKQIEGIELILPIYQQLSDADPIILSYGKGLLAHSKGQFNSAIRYYREIIAKHPEMSAVRLDLAQALYAHHQHIAARKQFEKLQSESLPEELALKVKQAIFNIDREQDWQWNANLYFRNERNINNAPKQREIKYGNGTIITPKPEKAQGIHVDLGASKRFNLKDNFYTKLQFDINSDIFWNNHKYDDVSGLIGFGLGYQTASLVAEIQPFAKKRFYETDPYSTSYGSNAFFSYQFTPNFKLSNNWFWEEERFDTRTHLNGPIKFVGLSAFFMRDARQYWFGGVNLYHKQAQDKEDTFLRKGAYIGVGQEWQGGLSSQLIFSFGKRDYKGQDFFYIKRSDNEYSAKLSFWHRNIHWLDITPRLVFSWDKTKSNHFLYNTEEKNVNIEFSKSF